MRGTYISSESSKSKLMETRKEIERGWRATSDILVTQGHSGLAAQVRRFLDQMPRSRTERELIKDQRANCVCYGGTRAPVFADQGVPAELSPARDRTARYGPMADARQAPGEKADAERMASLACVLQPPVDATTFQKSDHTRRIAIRGRPVPRRHR